MKQPLLEKRDACPSCGGSSLRAVYQESYSSPKMTTYLQEFYSQQGSMSLSILKNYYFEVAQCGDCGLIFQTYVPSDSFVFDVYEKWLDPEKTFSLFEKDHDLQYYLDYLQQIYQFIHLFKSPPSQLKFFDFGMGWGNWLVAAKAFGCEVFGCDLSPKRTEYARRRGVNIFEIEQESDVLFDFINVDQVLEHLREPSKVLHQLKKKLKPSGYMRVGVPNGNLILELLKSPNWSASKSSAESLNAIAPIEHLNCFTTESLLKLITSVGLEPMEIPAYPNLRVVAEAPQHNIDLKEWLQVTRRAMKQKLKPIFRKVFPAPGINRQWQGTNFLCRLKSV